MDPQLVSVVIPAYNAAEYLEETLSSVLSQTHRNLEVLVIDDGSTDSTADIGGSTDDQRVRVLTFPNGGLPTARNRGLDLARGEYIAFLDADDVWDTTKLERQILALIGSDAVGVGSKMRYISARGRTGGECGESPENSDAQERIRLARFMPFPISSVLFRTAVVRDIGGFDESLKQVEDLEFLSRMAARGRITWVPEKLGSYRVHSKSMTSIAHSEQRRLARFVMARASSRRAGKDLTWDEFIESDNSTFGQRRRDQGATWFRAAGVNAMNGDYIRAGCYMLGALILRPQFSIRRLRLRSKSTY